MTTTDTLPHDEYIAAVAAALADCGVRPGAYWTETPDGEQLDAVLINFPSDQIDRAEWPHGVYLGWDQHRGWLLIEQGGGRNVHDLDPGGVRTFSSPRQVAVSTANALHGRSTGPICERPWDSRSLEAAIKDWQDATD